MPSIYAAGGILINTDIIDPASITSWDDLLAEGMLDQVVMHNPARPGAGETLAMYLIDVKGEDFVRELLGNDRITLTSDYRQVVDLVARGTNPIALGALLANIQHYEDRGVDNLEIFWTNDVPGYVLGGGAVLAVPAGAPHPKAAAVFANWFLSQNGQEALALTQALPTDREDVDADLWPEYSDPRNRPELLNLYSQSWFFGTRLENRALLEGILAE